MSLIAFLAALAATSAPPSSAQTRCHALAEQAATDGLEINSTIPIASTPELPAYCQITGVIAPNIGFEARAPLTDWNQKYYQTGCGGFCGAVLPDKTGQSNAINHALKRGYATITTDGGHRGKHIGDASWARNNPEAEEVYAHRAIPLTYAAGQQLITAFYGKPAQYRYFSGCSNGGRMAMIAAQRYPTLFDGIISGCPVLDLSTSGGVFGAWLLQKNLGADGAPVLDHRFTNKLALLEAAVETQCDAADGAVDGVISEPASCKVDLDAIQTCNTRQTACLTRAEKNVIAAWYQGPVNSKGEQLFAGVPAGSERFWAVWYLGGPNAPAPGLMLADGYGRYLAYQEDHENFSARDFNFDTDVSGLAARGALYDALDPDLSAFRNAGGKLIMWHGAADPLVLPNQSEDYYRAVRAKMGDEETSSFFRYFVAPGMGHCWEAPADGYDQFEMLPALEKWVEQGRAPDAIPASRLDVKTGAQHRAKLLPYPASAQPAQ